MTLGGNHGLLRKGCNMANYNTCIGCTIDKTKCTKRAEIKGAIAGLSVTTIRFKCEERVSLFQPGDRVTTRWFHYNSYEDVDEYEFDGTVIQETYDRKFIVKIDAGQKCIDYFRNDNLIVKVKRTYIQKLDEPSIIICKDCEAGPCVAGDLILTSHNCLRQSQNA
jgi:hypothetical protein